MISRTMFDVDEEVAGGQAGIISHSGDASDVLARSGVIDEIDPKLVWRYIIMVRGPIKT